MQKIFRVGVALVVVSMNSGWVSADTAGPNLGFHNESEVGVVITTGNTRANTFNVKQANNYGWDTHSFIFNANVLDTVSFGVENARSYLIGIRFEEKISESLVVI